MKWLLVKQNKLICNSYMNVGALSVNKLQRVTILQELLTDILAYRDSNEKHLKSFYKIYVSIKIVYLIMPFAWRSKEDMTRSGH